MAAAKKAKVLATFKHPMQIEVREAKFEPLESASLLDHARLRRGNHRVEIGFAEGGCCKRAVTAIVKNGMVTDIEIADCEGSKKPPSKEMLGVIQAARKQIGMPAPAAWKPVPVERFFDTADRPGDIVISWGNWCVQICITWGGSMRCYYCCAWPPHCGSDTIATGPLS
jgi:hypothetical protein